MGAGHPSQARGVKPKAAPWDFEELAARATLCLSCNSEVHVLLMETEGQHVVQVFDSPRLEDSKVIGEIPSGQRVQCVTENGEALGIRTHDIEGWVKRKNAVFLPFTSEHFDMKQNPNDIITVELSQQAIASKSLETPTPNDKALSNLPSNPCAVLHTQLPYVCVYEAPYPFTTVIGEIHSGEEVQCFDQSLDFLRVRSASGDVEGWIDVTGVTLEPITQVSCEAPKTRRDLREELVINAADNAAMRTYDLGELVDIYIHDIKTWMPAEVTNVFSDGSLEVQSGDSKTWLNQKQQQLYLRTGNRQMKPINCVYSAGEVVKVWSRSQSMWMDAQVTSVLENGTIDVLYCNLKLKKTIPAESQFELVRPSSKSQCDLDSFSTQTPPSSVQSRPQSLY